MKWVVSTPVALVRAEWHEDVGVKKFMNQARASVPSISEVLVITSVFNSGNHVYPISMPFCTIRRLRSEGW